MTTIGFEVDTLVVQHVCHQLHREIATFLRTTPRNRALQSADRLVVRDFHSSSPPRSRRCSVLTCLECIYESNATPQTLRSSVTGALVVIGR